MADLDTLLNSKISLISHQDLRYDGTLFTINTDESSIVLKDVQCLGTEERISDPAKKIPSNPAIIPFVTFPGEEIKDLYVHEEVTPVVPTAPTAKPTATATSSSKATSESKPETSKQQNEKKNIYQPPRPPASAETGEKGKKQHNNAHSQQSKTNISSTTTTTTTVRRENKSDGVGAGTGAHLLKMRERRGNDVGAAPLATAGEFDFEAGLNVFKKDEVLAKVAKDTEEVKEVKYKKDDFFDTISCDLLDRQEGIKNRLTPGEERTLNQDTFGAVALQNNNYRRNFRGGGRGGGGRHYNNGGRYYNNGRGRGRGRGNNNHSTPVASASA